MSEGKFDWRGRQLATLVYPDDMLRLGWFVLALAQLPVALAQLSVALPAADNDPTDVLVRLRDQVTAHAQHIPDYTCIETIQRDRFRPTGSAPKSCDALLARRKKAGPGIGLKAGSMDRLRLDVAKTAGGETYSWPGDVANRYDGIEILRLIRDGSFGTGPFAAMLLDLFGSPNTRFFYDGDSTQAGRRVMQYSFQMPQEVSDYQVRAGQSWLVTGFSGTLLVEPQSAALIRITIRTDELPVASTACEADTTLDYSTVQISGLGYLLPTAARQRFISRDGGEEENTISFAGCKEFQAEAIVPSPEAVRFPAGLPVTIEVTSSVALDQAAAGDHIEGHLVFAVMDQQHQVLLPAGAIVLGRFMRVETHYSMPRDVTVALRWENVEVEGTRTPISLNPVKGSSGSGKRVLTLGGLLTGATESEPGQAGEERYAILHFHGDHPLLKTGVRTDWTTVTQ